MERFHGNGDTVFVRANGASMGLEPPRGGGIARGPAEHEADARTGANRLLGAEENAGAGNVDGPAAANATGRQLIGELDLDGIAAGGAAIGGGGVEAHTRYNARARGTDLARSILQSSEV